MKKRKRIVISGFILFILMGIMWSYFYMAAPSMEQAYQLNKMIKSHEISLIKKLSDGQQTEKLLMNFPKDTKVFNTDFQGGYKSGGYIYGYFPARIGKVDFATYMKKRDTFELIPHWTLYLISVEPQQVYGVKSK
jgi:hypothetical protein